MTLTLSPELERKVLEKAALREVDPNTIVEDLIREVFELEETDAADMDAGIERGFAAFEAGRYRPFSEFVADQKRKYGL